VDEARERWTRSRGLFGGHEARVPTRRRRFEGEAKAQEASTDALLECSWLLGTEDPEVQVGNGPRT
jgi:hypothetical protein